MDRGIPEQPDQAAALGYGAALTAATAYAVYRNDFGAEGRTTAELQDYLEEFEDADSCIGSPLKKWKAHEYRKELDEREEITRELATDFYAEEERIAYADD